MSPLDGALAFFFLLSIVLTFIAGSVAAVLFRRSIARNMRASTEVSSLDPARHAVSPRRSAGAPLTFSIENAAAGDDGIEVSGRILRHFVIVHAMAGLAFAITSTVLLLLLSGMEFFPVRTAAVIWGYAWPTLLVVNIVVGPDRRLQGQILLGYLGGVFALCIAAWVIGTPEFVMVGTTIPGILTPALFWAITAAPTFFLLLFLNRTIRGMGPVILVFMFVACLGSMVTLRILETQWGMTIGVQVGLAIGLGALGIFLSFAAFGFVVASWPAWRLVSFLRDRYAGKRYSDLMLTVSSIWLLESLLVANGLFREQGAVGLAAAALPFVVWYLTLKVGLHQRARTAKHRPTQHLLLLRTFGFGRRTQRLLDLLGTRWRLLGSVNLIAAPDVAARAIEPSSFLEFIKGNLHRLFVRTPAELQARMDRLDALPDPDGRYRINQLFCSGEIWKATVIQLMGRASLVVMDLRGFASNRHGVVFELQTLLDLVALNRLILLVDHTTDLSALKSVLAERWQHLDAKSPNLSLANTPLLLLTVDQSDPRAARRVLAQIGRNEHR